MEQYTAPQHTPKRQTTKWENMSLGAKIVGMAGLAFIALIALWIILAVISALANHSNANTSNASKSTPAQSTNSNTKAQTQPTTAQLVADWNGKYGHIFTTLANDSSNISTDGKNADSTSMNSDCNQLKIDVSTAQSYPAIPDAQSASDWSSALSYFADAAQDCIDGTANLDASLLKKSANEMSSGTTKTLAAAADIKKLTNQ